MNTTEIDVILKRHNNAKYYFGGVFSRDCLPLLAKYRAYIVNLDKMCDNGSHWIAIFFDKNRKAEYFDSYGLPPLFPEIISFLDQNSVSWSYNSKRLQSRNTLVCGQYCIYYILNRLKHKSLKKIINEFSFTYFKNDRKVYDLIKNLKKNIHYKFK